MEEETKSPEAQPVNEPEPELGQEISNGSNCPELVDLTLSDGDEDLSDENLSDDDLSDEDLSDEDLSDEDLSDEDLSDGDETNSIKTVRCNQQDQDDSVSVASTTQQQDQMDVSDDSSDVDCPPTVNSDSLHDQYGDIEYAFMWDHETLYSNYNLWHHNEEFRNWVAPLTDLIKRYGCECVSACLRAKSRKPTVDEFFNYVLSKTIARVDWIGVLKVVNTERQGWPIQHSPKANVVVHNVTFSSMFTPPKIERTVTPLDDRDIIDCDRYYSLWEIEPIRAGDNFDHEGQDIDISYLVLEAIRHFYEVVYVTDKSHDFCDYVLLSLYNRLSILFLLEHSCPPEQLSYVFTKRDRGQIIAGLKQYHAILNSIVETEDWLATRDKRLESEEVRMEVSAQDQPSADDEQVEKMNKLMRLRMQQKRQELELKFLDNSDLRKVMDDDNPECSGHPISNYDKVLVMKELDVTDMYGIYTQLKHHITEEESCSMRICTDLEQALRNCSKGATIFVTSGNYRIGDLRNLAFGGSLIGIQTDGKDVTISPTDEIGDIWLLYRGLPESQLAIKYIDFVIGAEEADMKLETVFRAVSGRVLMDNVRIRNLNENLINAGCKLAVKSESAKVVAVDCDFLFDDAN